MCSRSTCVGGIIAAPGRGKGARPAPAALGRLADEYLVLDTMGLAAAQAAGAIVEVKCDDQAVQE